LDRWIPELVRPVPSAARDHPRRAGDNVTVPAVSGPTELPVPPALHELEAEVMEVVWERGESSVREVMQALNARAPRERAYTTYMTIMSRLDAKGMLERRRQGKTDLYTPTYVRDQYASIRARAELESVVNQYGEVALAHIARQMAALDPRRRRALQRMARGR
jgi:predicted transcriptional regulator